jgi:hypothetical protein
VARILGPGDAGAVARSARGAAARARDPRARQAELERLVAILEERERKGQTPSPEPAPAPADGDAPPAWRGNHSNAGDELELSAVVRRPQQTVDPRGGSGRECARQRRTLRRTLTDVDAARPGCPGR